MRPRLNPAAMMVGAILLLSCAAPPEPQPWNPEDFPNVLALRGAPEDARDLDAFAFSDLGAWHMFGLPDPDGSGTPGSFPGPLLLAEGGLWLSPAMVGPELRLDGETVLPGWDPNSTSPSTYFPGLLRQELVAGPLKLRLELVFASSRSNEVRAEILNPGPAAVELGWGWTGGDLFLDATASQDGGKVAVQMEESGTRVILEPRGKAEEIRVYEDGPLRYRIREAPVLLAPGESLTRYLRISVRPPEEARGGNRSGQEGSRSGQGGSRSAEGGSRSAQGGGAEAQVWEEDPQEAFSRARTRWAGYLDAVLEARDGTKPSPTVQERVAVKAIQTLISNWRVPRGHLFHAGLFPSYAYRGFHGIWSWDSWKHARALALFAPELAEDQMRVMLDYQNAEGMIPDVIYADSTENNWRDTKPPLAAWAVQGIFRATADTSFVQEVYPALLRYHQWWYRNRDHDGNGLCEYGSTDGTRIAAAWESGMDNAVRFDDAIMVENHPGAWSLNQESVDLNAYLFAEKGYLAELAQVVGRGEEARVLLEERDALGALIRETFFDESSGFFYDVHLETKAPIRVDGPEGWIPLWAGAATQEEAESVAGVMLDPEKFLGRVPLPTLAMDHPDFDPSNGYWRGPVWLDQAYFGIQGLRRYGFDREARDLTRRLVESAEGLAGNGPIFENYHPLSGEGLNAAHFSWSAAHLLMLYQEGFMEWDAR